MGVFISRINIEVYSESVLEIFASFTIITCVSEKYGHFYLAQSEQKNQDALTVEYGISATYDYEHSCMSKINQFFCQQN